MAWNIQSVGFSPADVASPLEITAPGAVGKLYVLIFTRTSATGDCTGVTDDGGNTWTLVHFAPLSGTSGRRIYHWYCVPTNPFSVVSATFTGTSNSAQARLIEITGFASSGLVHAEASGIRTSSATPAEYQVTTSIANCLLIYGIQHNTNNHDTGVTAEAGWTELPAHPDGPAVAYKIQSTAGTDGCSWTSTNSQGSGHSIVAYAPGPQGPAVTVWNGTTEVAATIEGVWNGSVVVPYSSIEVT